MEPINLFEEHSIPGDQDAVYCTNPWHGKWYPTDAYVGGSSCNEVGDDCAGTR